MAIEELRRLTKWGNGYGVMIPKRYVCALQMKVNDLVIIRLTHKTFEIIPYERNNQSCRK